MGAIGGKGKCSMGQSIFGRLARLIVIAVVFSGCATERAAESDPEPSQHISMYDIEVGDDGVGRLFYKDGSLAGIVPLQAGKPHGRVVEYFPNGQMKTEGHWNEGRPAGVFRAWNEDGMLIQVEQWENGVSILDVPPIKSTKSD
jgi:hypothetical protein